MNKEKVLRILIIVFGIIVIALIVILAIVLINKKGLPAPVQTISATPPQNYSVDISELNGIYSGSLQQGSTKVTIPSQFLINYIITSINSTHDIMSLICPLGYSNTASQVISGSARVARDPATGSNVEIIPNQQETISISCSKS